MTIEKIEKFIQTCKKIEKGDARYCSHEFIKRAHEIADLLLLEYEDKIEC